MGYLFLGIAKLTWLGKILSMKQSGRLCPGSYNSVRINTARALICCAVSVIIWLCAGIRGTLSYTWVWIVSGIANALNMFIYILCAEKVGLVFVEAFALVGGVVIPLLAAPFLYAGETVRVFQWVGCALMFCAVLLFSLKPRNKETEKEKRKTDWITIACLLLCMLSNAGVCITQKLYVERVGQSFVGYFNMMTFATVFVCFAAVLLSGKCIWHKPFLPAEARSVKKLGLYIGIAAVMMYASQYTSSLAVASMPSAIFYPLSQGVGMVLSVISDVAIYKQKITVGIVGGLLLTVGGMVLIYV